MFKVELIVRPRSGVRDPQGDAVQGSLHDIGYDTAKVECVGRYLLMELDVENEEAARAQTDEMCKRLLVNPNLETYELTVKEL